MNEATITQAEENQMLRKLIALCLTDGKAAYDYCQTLPDQLYQNHDLVRVVENYNPQHAAEIPECGVILSEILSEVVNMQK